MNLGRILPYRRLACLIGLSMAFAAQAKDDGIDPSVTVEKSIQRYVVSSDGSFVETNDQVLLINEERAIKAQGQIALSYNQTLESLEVVEAYTLKPDGRKVIVEPDHVKDQQEAVSANAPMFQDTRVKVIIFPEVAIGDRLVFQSRTSRTTPYFPSQFSDLTIPSAHEIKQLRRIYDMPDNLELHSDSAGFESSPTSSGKGRKLYQWDYVPSERHRMEAGSVSYADYGDHLAVSTFVDYSEYAKAYDARARDKSASTPNIHALAEKITHGMSDPREKAMALSNWMRENIRYVAVYIGAGGVVPHSADTIVRNLYGDCKDHVTLLEAMLSAVGIESTPALINSGNSYRWDKVPTGFNHVITYIPSLNLFLDSTAENIASGYLPDADMDKPVLLARNGQASRTPASQKVKTTNELEFNVEPNGAASFSNTINSIGAPAEAMRYAIRNAKKADLDIFAERILRMHGQTGSGNVDIGMLDGFADNYSLGMRGRTENLVNLPGPVGVPTSTNLIYGISAVSASLNSEKVRTQDFICLDQEFTEHSRFNIPEQISIVAIPKPVKWSDPIFDFSSEYGRQGNSVTISRTYRFHHGGMVCSAEDFKKMRPGIDLLVRDVQSQIILQAE